MIRAFNLDFNWDFAYRPASPGLYTFADPEAHAAWYEDLGANVAMLNTLAFNGYAWYPSDVAPRTPGPGENFTPRAAEELRKRGIAPMGYFTIGYNPWWDEGHRDVRHEEVPQVCAKTPLLPEYLEFTAAHLGELFDRVDLDGLMVDWLQPTRRGVWLAAEREDWRRLLGESFPACGEPSAEAKTEYDRAVLARAWATVRGAVKAHGSEKIVWTNHPFERAEDPVWNGHPALREADWILNEDARPEFLSWIEREAGAGAKILQNLCGWDAHDADAILARLDPDRFGLFGFACCDPVTTLLAEDGNVNVRANARNVPKIRAHYRGMAGLGDA